MSQARLQRLGQVTIRQSQSGLTARLACAQGLASSCHNIFPLAEGA